VHPYLLVLGLIINIVLGLLLANFTLNEKQEKIAFIIYNVGVSLTGLLLLTRGTFDVLVKTNNYEISGTLSLIISGLAGISHIILAVGLIYYFVLIIKSYKKQN
jgi:heme/copper-type cytochrome/quinol oxidase subunit 1